MHLLPSMKKFEDFLIQSICPYSTDWSPERGEVPIKSPLATNSIKDIVAIAIGPFVPSSQPESKSWERSRRLYQLSNVDQDKDGAVQVTSTCDVNDEWAKGKDTSESHQLDIAEMGQWRLAMLLTIRDILHVRFLFSF
jgi:hypothetical protein